MGNIFKMIMGVGIASLVITYMCFGLYLNWKNEERIQTIETQLLTRQKKKDELYLEFKNLEYVKKSLLNELALEKEKKRQRELIKELLAADINAAAVSQTDAALKSLPTISAPKTTTVKKTSTTTTPTTTTPKKKTRAS
ncbi:MAG: hypothetical protein NDI94_04855 [Candidatus Woesearchaeota archaeon]|nr:hypothetical protein [Candidatus Woesearchaeota archaeon]